MAELSLAALRHNYQLALAIDLAEASSYARFADLVEETIDGVLNRMAENPQLRQGRTEDELTIELVDNLRSMGVEAGHDVKIGGHCDVVVRAKHKFVWFGEAKIHSAYDWLLKGYRQLVTRYAPGANDTGRGGRRRTGGRDDRGGDRAAADARAKSLAPVLR